MSEYNLIRNQIALFERTGSVGDFPGRCPKHLQMLFLFDIN